MRVIIIGSGNTAFVLGKKIISAGHKVLQVVGRNAEAIEELAGLLEAGTSTDLKKIRQDADIYIIAIADDAIAEVANQLNLDKKLVVHTAGSVSKEVLKNSTASYGVLWPVQSLRKEMSRLPDIPFLVDGNSDESKEDIVMFALTMGAAKIGGDEERLKLHLAAVLVNNFTNHVYALADIYCKKENLVFGMLQELILSTAERINPFPPAMMQTGPAIRHDTRTIDRHLALLNDHPELKEFYTLFTNSIKKMYP